MQLNVPARMADLRPDPGRRPWYPIAQDDLRGAAGGFRKWR